MGMLKKAVKAFKEMKPPGFKDHTRDKDGNLVPPKRKKHKNAGKKWSYGDEEERAIKAGNTQFRLSNTPPNGIAKPNVRKVRTKAEVEELDAKNTRKGKLYKSIMGIK